ncbi:glycosyltransferase family 4 protein [Massilia sp. CT11-108]|uniref:glycosyltransferase family 4 protein n=1 Tax=Massilia sp. CT11-108 TaxID=3393900 RepID=UPI0039A70056
MRVLHVIVCLDVGGAEMMLRRLIESHKDNPEYEHIVVSLTDIGCLGQQMQELGTRVVSLRMRSGLEFCSVLFRLRNLIRKFSPNVVQTWMYHADLLGGLAARLAGNKNILWGIHSTDVRAGGSRMTTWVMRVCAKVSRWVPDTILCVAEVSRQVHIAAGYFEPRTLVLPNGIDTARLVSNDDRRRAIRNTCGFTDDHIVIGTLGRFNPAKDYGNFVSAAGIIAEKYLHVRFVMVGSHLNGDNATLREWIDKTGFSERFVLLGQRSDAPDCLAAMDIFCLSSKSEALPTVVIEAMGMGVPCVATDVGDTRVLVQDIGIVVPREDSAALAAGLEKVIEMPAEERHALACIGKARVRENYTIERARDRLEALYTEIVNRNR